MPARKTSSRDQSNPVRGAGAGVAACAVGEDEGHRSRRLCRFFHGETAGFSAGTAVGAAAGISDAFTSSVRVVGGKQTPPSPSVQGW